MDKLFNEMLNYLIQQYPFLSSKPLKPLAFGSGKEIADCLHSAYQQEDVSEFVTFFFSRRDYKLALINTYKADKTRYHISGTPTLDSVKEDEILGLARHGMFKRKDGLTDQAKQLVKSQQKYVSRRRSLLKKQVIELKLYGFSDEFIRARLGNRTDSLLKKYTSVKPKLKSNDLKEAELMKRQISNLNRKELKAFQRKLYQEGFPIPLILTASNHYEPLLYELILPEISNPKLVSPRP